MEYNAKQYALPAELPNAFKSAVFYSTQCARVIQLSNFIQNSFQGIWIAGYHHWNTARHRGRRGGFRKVFSPWQGMRYTGYT